MFWPSLSWFSVVKSWTNPTQNFLLHKGRTAASCCQRDLRLQWVVFVGFTAFCCQFNSLARLCFIEWHLWETSALTIGEITIWCMLTWVEFSHFSVAARLQSLGDMSGCGLAHSWKLANCENEQQNLVTSPRITERAVTLREVTLEGTFELPTIPFYLEPTQLF